jgi:cytochrome c biogenesis protein CcmG/thiol:disulfide interchange protein DsbE
MGKRKFTFLMIGGIVLGSFLVLAIIVPMLQPRHLPPSFEKPVEEFTLNDLNDQPISLSNYRGKAVVLNFWLTTCEPCVREMPLLLSYYQRFSPELVVLGINSGDSKINIQEFLNDHQIAFPILLDNGGKTTQMFYVRGYPSTFFIDADGVLRAQHIGELTEEMLLSYLTKIGIAP